MCPYLDLLLGFRDSSERCCIKQSISEQMTFHYPSSIDLAVSENAPVRLIYNLGFALETSIQIWTLKIGQIRPDKEGLPLPATRVAG